MEESDDRSNVFVLELLHGVSWKKRYPYKALSSCVVTVE